jgi:HEAT repeat protein
MKLYGILLAAACLAAGCAKANPTLSGGHPVSHWVEALKSRDAKERQKAVAKLGNVGPSDAAVVPALLGALKDPAAEVRRETIVALVKCGADARSALPTLANLRQSDRDAKVRDYAGRAMSKLQDG